MKKPEEIKKGLECCANSSFCDEECPYFEECNEGLESHATDALAYIQQLEAELETMLSHLKNHATCSSCKHCYEHLLVCDENDFLCDECDMDSCACKTCEENCCWEWSGKPLPEAPKEDAK